VKKKPLQVVLHAREPSLVEFTVGDRVQLDRLTLSPHGYVAERHGKLLEPGVTTLALAEGQYFFKTLADTHLRVICGGVETSASTNGTKNPFPDPPAQPPPPGGLGDEPEGEPPQLTVQ